MFRPVEDRDWRRTIVLTEAPVAVSLSVATTDGQVVGDLPIREAFSREPGDRSSQAVSASRPATSGPRDCCSIHGRSGEQLADSSESPDGDAMTYEPFALDIIRSAAPPAN